MSGWGGPPRGGSFAPRGRGGPPRGSGRGGPPRGGRGGGRGGGGGPPFRKAGPDDPRINSEVQIFVENLPKDVKIQEIKAFFSTVGEIKVDRLTKKPRIWLYHDKGTGEPTGECTITYSATEVQRMALQTYDGAGFRGGAATVRVTPSIVKSHMARPPPPPMRGRGRGRGGPRGGPRGGRGGPPGRGGRGGPPRGGFRGGPPGRGGFGGPRGGYDRGGYGGGYGGGPGYGGGDRGGFGGGGRFNPY